VDDDFRRLVVSAALDPPVAVQYVAAPSSVDVEHGESRPRAAEAPAMSKRPRGFAPTTG
jgi:hypothetical protein